MRQVLGRANSSNVMKVVWLLDELGLPYERTDVGGTFGGTDAPEYVAMNPNRTIPTLVEGDFVLWESNAILRYLASAHVADAPIWPADVRARASIDRWMDWQQTTLGRPQTTVFQGLVRTAPEKRDQAAIASAVQEVGRHWSLLDHMLERNDYVAGPAFSLADVALGVHVHRWFSFDIKRPETPHLRAWYERLLQRPDYAKHVAIPMT